MKRSLLLPVLGFLAWAGAAGAAPITVTLSQVSSDGTPSSQLDATVTFTVTGTTLTVAVTNLTSSPATFSMTDVFFNGSTDVTGLSLTGQSGVSGWILGGPQAADGFGTYDFALNSGTNLASGGTATFTFSITGSGTIDETDFVGNDTFSTIPPGDISAQVAAQFAQGPSDPECALVVFPTTKCPQGPSTEDSAFGAGNGDNFPPVPEPGTFVLVGLGLAGLGAAGRRR